MKIAIGCDPNAIELKNVLMNLCVEVGHEAADFGSDDPIYANTAIRVAEAVASGNFDRGVLICGTGIGMSIAANKVKGAYAALITDTYSAERAQLSNNTNIACFGAFTIGSKVAESVLKIWLSLTFDPCSRSMSKVQRIINYEQNVSEKKIGELL
ncbi:MAG: RpiB/LacA/LacB family sugar-phosphate isomerase [Clostridiales Family XIII bacterium]|jgi:ribose 5-phosphate isomerase B|nr:RpiB/LacA/LacB family sugar-phosphate isomerase [Clostridiales Family XIII bacterium]